MEGLDAAVESCRQFMGRCDVSRFRAYDHVVTRRGKAAVVESDRDMALRYGTVDHEARGREILVPACRDDAWRFVWRTQLSAGAGFAARARGRRPSGLGRVRNCAGPQEGFAVE
jgi:hypothetical protein